MKPLLEHIHRIYTRTTWPNSCSACAGGKQTYQRCSQLRTVVHRRWILNAFRAGTRVGNAVPIVEVFKSALWTALRTFFWIKCTRLQDFAYTISKFSGGHTPPDIRKRPRCLDPDTNSACVASVSIVPVVRNDHWCKAKNWTVDICRHSIHGVTDVIQSTVWCIIVIAATSECKVVTCCLKTVACDGTVFTSRNSRSANTCADSIGHGVTCPTFTNGWARGAQWLEEQQTKTDQTVLTITKVLRKTNKKVEGHAKNFSGALRRTCAPLSNSFRHHCLGITLA